MGIEKRAICTIVADAAAQPRAGGLDERHVEDLRAAYERGDDVPRVTVWKIGHVCKLSKGFHRIEGAKRAGLTHLEVEYHVGTELEWKIDAFTSNTDHGLKRTSEDIRLAVEQLTALCPDWSDRRMAERLAVHHTTVAKYRPVLATVANTNEPAKREGSDGRLYNAAKPKPAAAPPPGPTVEEKADTGEAAEPAAEPTIVPDASTIHRPPAAVGRFDPSPIIDVLLAEWAKRLRAAVTAKDAASECERMARSLMEQAARLRAA